MYELDDKELGKIIIKPNKKAKHIIARKKSGYVQITVPYGFNIKNVAPIIQSMKPKLLKMKSVEPYLITEESVIDTYSFQAVFVRSKLLENIQASLINEKLSIFVPSNANFADITFQSKIKEVLIGVLRMEAKRILPEKTNYFASKHGLTYRDVKINKSRTRWGSCSRQKNINLSLFLLLMPERFIDYVVLHELTHTIHFNHSKEFWQLLNSLCNCDAKTVSKNLSKQTSESYRLLTQ